MLVVSYLTYHFLHLICAYPHIYTFCVNENCWGASRSWTFKIALRYASKVVRNRNWHSELNVNIVETSRAQHIQDVIWRQSGWGITCEFVCDRDKWLEDEFVSSPLRIRSPSVFGWQRICYDLIIIAVKQLDLINDWRGVMDRNADNAAS